MVQHAIPVVKFGLYDHTLVEVHQSVIVLRHGNHCLLSFRNQNITLVFG